MELCQFPTNTAAFSTRVDIIFKGLEIWMFAEFYYFPLALITGPGYDFILIVSMTDAIRRILFCNFHGFMRPENVEIALGVSDIQSIPQDKGI